MSPFHGKLADGDAFWGCRFCQGRGCLACPKESERAYKERFGEEGPQPLFTAHFDNPQEMAVLKDVFHMNNLKAVFEDQPKTAEEAILRAVSGEPTPIQKLAEQLEEAKQRHGLTEQEGGQA